MASNTQAAASLLRVYRSQLLTLRDHGLAGFETSGRVHLPTLWEAVKKWEGKTDREVMTIGYWLARFNCWADREGLPGVAPAWKGRGHSLPHPK